MTDWLERCGIRTVAMESTSVYWIPLFQIWEARSLEVCLVTARQVPPKPFGTRSGQQGAIETVAPEFLFYDVDTSSGQSGSPVFAMFNQEAVVAGIHVSGSPARNCAIRVTPSVLDEI